jgi:phospholipid transport system transporter-binding protein
MLLLPATVTAHEARDALRMLAIAIEREPGTDIVIHAGSLHQFDSSAIAVLLECERLAQAWGKTFAVRDAPPKLGALAKLYGVDGLLIAAGPPAGAEPATRQSTR